MQDTSQQLLEQSSDGKRSVYQLKSYRSRICGLGYFHRLGCACNTVARFVTAADVKITKISSLLHIRCWTTVRQFDSRDDLYS